MHFVFLLKAKPEGASGRWVTMRGRHVFVMEGQTPAQALAGQTPQAPKMVVAVKDRHAKSSGQGQGMNWIKKPKRLALYLRDGMACTWCGAKAEDGAKLTLDHLVPHSHGGSNEADNVTTTCHTCNSARGNRDVNAFAKDVAQFLDHDVTPHDVLDHIKTSVTRPYDVQRGKDLLQDKGFRAVVEQVRLAIPQDVQANRGPHHARLPRPAQL